MLHTHHLISYEVGPVVILCLTEKEMEAWSSKYPTVRSINSRNATGTQLCLPLSPPCVLATSSPCLVKSHRLARMFCGTKSLACLLTWEPLSHHEGICHHLYLLPEPLRQGTVETLRGLSTVPLRIDCVPLPGTSEGPALFL